MITQNYGGVGNLSVISGYFDVVSPCLDIGLGDEPITQFIGPDPVWITRIHRVALTCGPPAEVRTGGARTHSLIRLPVPDRAAVRQTGEVTGQVTGQVTPHATPQGTPQVTPHVGTKSALSRHQVEILEKCREFAALADLMAITERSDRTRFRHGGSQ